MKSLELYHDVAHAIRGIVGEWAPAAHHLHRLGWTLQDWERWANECQAGSLAEPNLGLTWTFEVHADDIGLAKNLRGNGDDVATCLACIWLWICLDRLLPEGESKVIDKVVAILASPQESEAA